MPTTGGSGRLFVADRRALREVDPETGAVTLVADGLALSGVEQKSIEKATSVGFLAGVTIGSGSLYVSGYPESRVYRIDP